MLFEVTHKTHYAYGAAVFLQPHTLRLRPASDASQRLLEFSLSVNPQPAGRSDNLELDGNDTTLVWFANMTDHLIVEARSKVETLRSNPFEFLWQVDTALPLRNPDWLYASLAPYLQTETHASVWQLARTVAVDCRNDAHEFLPTLTRVLHESCRQIRREEGEPMPADETLRLGEGSCRDLTVLMMEACRSQGFACRFVSGYHGVDAVDGNDLHAWPEVYIPGGGWRGFDPSSGFAVSDTYIALARAARPSEAAPMTGTYRGRATAPPRSEVNITRLDPE